MVGILGAAIVIGVGVTGVCVGGGEATIRLPIIITYLVYRNG